MKALVETSVAQVICPYLGKPLDSLLWRMFVSVPIQWLKDFVAWTLSVQLTHQSLPHPTQPGGVISCEEIT